METVGVDRLAALYTAIELVRRGGTISLSGVYGGMADPMPMMTLFDKQIQLRMGQANVQRWVPDILPLLLDGDPLGVEDFATHRLPLEAAPEAYATFQAEAGRHGQDAAAARAVLRAPMETITVGLWATNIEPPAASLAAWAALVETRMAEAQAAGAELFVLPEFACAQWLGFAPVGLPLDQQVPWLASLTEPALAALGPLPARYGVALLAGTMPMAVPGPGRRRRSTTSTGPG